MKSKGLLLAFLLITVLLITACSLGGSGGGGGGLPAPVKLTAIENSPTNISLTWTAVSGAVKYKVYFSVTATGQFMYRDETEEHNYLVSDLVPNNDYYFRVSSVDVNGIEGPQSTYVVGRTKGYAVTGVSLNKKSTSLTVGKTERLFPIIEPVNAENKTVTWNSGDPAIATVSQEGIVTGNRVGTTIITVKTVDGGFSDDCFVSVSAASIPVTGVYLNKSSISITIGSAENLAAVIMPSNATNQNVTWSSNNVFIAAVSQGGVVTGVSAGIAVITVTTAEGGYTDTCVVTVTAPIPVTGVSLSHTTLTLDVGDIQTLTATVTPVNATNKNVKWRSSNNDVVTVSTIGVVTAVSAGNAIITVTTDDGGYADNCAVTVSPVPVTGVSLNKASTALLVGGTETLTATVAPSIATNKNVTWSSDNTYIATVSSAGVITGVSVGSATITATTVDGSKTAACAVTVSAAPITVTGVSLNKTSASITLSSFEILTASITPSNATNQNVTWTTSNPGVATITNGVVIGVAVGNAVITVTTTDGNKTAVCTVTVSPIYVTGVSLNKTLINLLVGGMENLIATVTPTNATDNTITWSSSDIRIATVSSNGVVTAVSAGSAVISVTTVDGNKTASCSITVSAPVIPVTSVSLNNTSFSLTIGGTETLIATIAPSNATNQNVTWTTTNSNVAVVTEGVITGVSDGSATITVTTVDGGKKATCTVSVSGSVIPSGLATYLATLPANTASSPHNIVLKVTSVSEFLTIRTALNGAPNKYVNFDLTGSTVKEIPENAFYGTASPYGCATLIKINIPDGITSIEKNAFTDCTNLNSVTIPKSVTNIGGNVFHGCRSLTSVTIPSGVTSIGNSAFWGCGNLTSVIIPESVTSIGEWAFNDCRKLGNITIPESVTSIGNSAFFNCSSITSIIIPSNVTSIGSTVFEGCTRLINITIPKSVTSIGSLAFYGCSSLPSITIPDSVTNIGNSAFLACTNLISVTIPDSITIIGNEAFGACTSLVSVTFQGTIPSSGFSTSSVFPGDLRSKFYATNSNYGTSGTYTRASGGSTWTSVL